MNITNLKNLSNYSLARELFDNIAIYQLNKNPAQSLESFIGDIEKILDKVQDKNDRYKEGYNKGYDDGYYDNVNLSRNK